jgi:hypothetical protein
MRRKAATGGSCSGGTRLSARSWREPSVRACRRAHPGCGNGRREAPRAVPRCRAVTHPGSIRKIALRLQTSRIPRSRTHRGCASGVLCFVFTVSCVRSLAQPGRALKGIFVRMRLLVVSKAGSFWYGGAGRLNNQRAWKAERDEADGWHLIDGRPPGRGHGQAVRCCPEGAPEGPWLPHP